MSLYTTLLYRKEVANHKDLETRHDDDGCALEESKPKDPAFSGDHSARVAVFSGAEVLLGASHVRQCARETEERFIHVVERLWGLSTRATLLIVRSDFVLQSDLKVNELFCKGRHVVGKTECVFTDVIGCKHVVALPFAFAIQNHFVLGILHGEINVERATGLHLYKG